MRSRRTLLSAAGLFLAIAGCGRSGPDGSTPRAGTLSVDAVPDAGTVEITVAGVEAGVCPPDCSVDFEAGDEVSLLAQPEDANHSGWTGAAADDCPGTENPCTFVPSGDTTAGAYWTATLTLDPEPDGYGRIFATDLADCDTECDVEVPFGESTEFDAVESGPFFLEWSGACTGNDTTCSAAPTGPATLVATFSLVGAPRIAGSTAGNDYGEAVARDPVVAGGYLVTGNYDDAGFSFLGTSFALQGARNSFVARVSGANTVTWSESYGGDAGSVVTIHSIAADNSLSCYAAGSVTGAVDLEQDGGAVDTVGAINGFVLAQAFANATPTWVMTGLGSAANSRSVFADLDSEGSILGVTGTISLNVAVDGVQFDTANENRHHLFTFLLEEADGDLIAGVRHGENAASHAEGVAIEFASDGDPFVGGFYDVDFSDTNNSNSPCTVATAGADEDPVTFRLDGGDFTACEWASATAVDIGGEDRLTGLAEDGARVYIATIRIDDPETVRIYAFNADDGLTAANWTTPLEFTTTDRPGPFAIEDDSDNGALVIAGTFSGEIVIDGQTYTSNGGRDVIVVRVDASDQDVISVSQLGGDGDDVVGGPDLPGIGGTTFTDFDAGYAAGAVAVLDELGNAVITGWTTSTSFAGAPTTGDGSADLFVIRAAPPP